MAHDSTVTQYILFIHDNVRDDTKPEEWAQFFDEARKSGVFEGGSAVGKRFFVGSADDPKSSDHIVGYMRFDSDDRQKILDLLKHHPVVMHGGTVELCELPKGI